MSISPEDLSALPTRIGMIAGTGNFPLLIAQAARSHGVEVCAYCLKGNENENLRPLAAEFHLITLSRISAVIELARQHGVRHLILAGRIPHEVVLNPMILFDARVRRILGSLANRKADTILGAFTQELEKEGFAILDSTAFVRSAMPQPGLLTPHVGMSEQVFRDIEFGYRTAKAIAGLDIGQTVAVKEGVVVAVEALEGTDNLILRSGALAGEGIVFVKVAKPRQSMKFDVPIIGLQTIENLARVRAAGMCITARQSLFFDQPDALALAEKSGICLYAYEEQENAVPALLG